MRLKQYIVGAVIAKPQHFMVKASRGSNCGNASQEGMPGETSLNVLQGVVRKSSWIYRQHALNCKAEELLLQKTNTFWRDTWEKGCRLSLSSEGKDKPSHSYLERSPWADRAKEDRQPIRDLPARACRASVPFIHIWQPSVTLDKWSLTLSHQLRLSWDGIQEAFILPDGWGLLAETFHASSCASTATTLPHIAAAPYSLLEALWIMESCKWHLSTTVLFLVLVNKLQINWHHQDLFRTPEAIAISCMLLEAPWEGSRHTLHILYPVNAHCFWPWLRMGLKWSDAGCVELWR